MDVLRFYVSAGAVNGCFKPCRYVGGLAGSGRATEKKRLWWVCGLAVFRR